MEQIYRKINDYTISNKPLQQLHFLRAGHQDWFKLFYCGLNLAFIVRGIAPYLYALINVIISDTSMVL